MRDPFLKLGDATRVGWHRVTFPLVRCDGVFSQPLSKLNLSDVFEFEECRQHSVGFTSDPSSWVNGV